jgi:hypothetical protein
LNRTHVPGLGDEAKTLASCSFDDALASRKDAADDLGVDGGVVSVLPWTELA